ncbi:hypothetical protein D5S17_28450 [Pseudonocardiaceae bacterium YIM PH 21723]|nr:hypothetical protein D5S17_28450 [Pseudonocardiaceae bacterium YIM PH 21723]
MAPNRDQYIEQQWVKQGRRRARREKLARFRWLLVIPAVAALFGGAVAVSRYGLVDKVVNVVSPAPDAAAAGWLDPKYPFADSPAATWADGAAGIEPPAAAPVGGYSAEQVAAAAARVKELIVLSRLDRSVIQQGRTEPVTSRLSARARQELGGDLRTVVAKLTDQRPLMDAQPKVRGTMTFDVDEHGVLRAHTNYVFVYAFAPQPAGSHARTWDVLTLYRVNMDYLVIDDTARFDRDSQGLVPGGGAGSYYLNMDCALSKQGIIAPPTRVKVTVSAGVDDRGRSPESFFDPNSPMPTENSCK